jgi:hypothetical protein
MRAAHAAKHSVVGGLADSGKTALLEAMAFCALNPPPQPFSPPLPPRTRGLTRRVVPLGAAASERIECWEAAGDAAARCRARLAIAAEGTARGRWPALLLFVVDAAASEGWGLARQELAALLAASEAPPLLLVATKSDLPDALPMQSVADFFAVVAPLPRADSPRADEAPRRGTERLAAAPQEAGLAALSLRNPDAVAALAARVRRAAQAAEKETML